MKCHVCKNDITQYVLVGQYIVMPSHDRKENPLAVHQDNPIYPVAMLTCSICDGVFFISANSEKLKELVQIEPSSFLPEEMKSQEERIAAVNAYLRLKTKYQSQRTESEGDNGNPVLGI